MHIQSNSDLDRLLSKKKNQLISILLLIKYAKLPKLITEFLKKYWQSMTVCFDYLGTIIRNKPNIEHFNVNLSDRSLTVSNSRLLCQGIIHLSLFQSFCKHLMGVLTTSSQFLI